MEQPVAAPAALVPDLIDSLHESTLQFGAAHPDTVLLAHRLAIALWKMGDVDQSIGLLDQALRTISSDLEHPCRPDLLCALGEILADQERWEQAARVYSDLVDDCIRKLGSNHERTIAAKGDFAAVLFELGRTSEAEKIESDACEDAQRHLGNKHPVTCVLAWNRAMRLEEHGDRAASAAILENDLMWLLTEDDAKLLDDHRTVKAMLSDHCCWQSAAVSVS